MSELLTEESSGQLQGSPHWIIEAIGTDLVIIPIFLGIIAVQAIRKWLELKAFRSSFRLRTEIKADALLNRCHALLGPERSMILHFHNGDPSMISGFHQKFMSVSFEVTSPGVSEAFRYYQKVPVTRVLDRVKPLLDGGWRVTPRATLPEGFYKNYLTSVGTETVLERIVYSHHIPVAVLSFHYKGRFTFDVEPRVKNEIEDYVRQLATIL